MDLVWIGIAFVFGFAARQCKLPPLVGFLIAGFVLKAMGMQGGDLLETVSELGVTLLLFSIGLKLKIQTLLRPQVWAVASTHMFITVLIYSLGIFGLSTTGLSLFSGLDFQLSLLIAFALSFSSTVFAVKVLEEKGESSTLHGRIAIGILIMQDIAAVVFIAISMAKVPSPWAIALLALLPLRPVLMAILGRCGHGELLILYGLLLAFGGGLAFEVVYLKGDLGALIMGILLAGHPKSPELARSLLGFKDLFLVGFFLSIGFAGTPSLAALEVALLLSLAVSIKVVLFFLLLTHFQLRARTSLLTSLSLANYSEFGLIVGAIGLDNGWVSPEWLVAIALSLSITFVIASPLNSAAHSIYARLDNRLKRYETGIRLPDDRPIDPGNAEIVIFGMGRVGTGAYDLMRERHGDVVLGIDADNDVVLEHQSAGRTVKKGDPTDPDFWEMATDVTHHIKLVMLALPNHRENLYIVEAMVEKGFDGIITATAKFPDERIALKEAGAHAAYNIYAEAGAGFAEHVNETYTAGGEVRIPE